MVLGNGVFFPRFLISLFPRKDRPGAFEFPQVCNLPPRVNVPAAVSGDGFVVCTRQHKRIFVRGQKLAEVVSGANGSTGRVSVCQGHISLAPNLTFVSSGWVYTCLGCCRYGCSICLGVGISLLV